MTWRDEPMLAFDLETTAPDPEQARIVTACAGLASSADWEPSDWLLKQEQDIPAEATAIHGITTERANTDGRDPAECVLEVRNVILTAWSLGRPVVGYNIVYDLTVLDRESRRHGHGALPILGPVIDPLVLDKAIDRYRRGSRKLVDVCAHYGIKLVEAHDSTADALAAARLAWRLAAFRPGSVDYSKTGDGEHLPPLMTMPLADVHQFQVEAYETQRRSFAGYRRRQGQPLDDESTDWPIRHFPERTAA